MLPMLAKAIGGRFEIKGVDHFFVKGFYIEKGNPNISEEYAELSDFTKLEFRKEAASKISVTMTAEGFRKIALLQRLIDVGALIKGQTSVLLWDEPESNINPILMKLLVTCLLELARNGQQIIIATHDYVLLKWSDLLMEKSKGDYISFHALYRDKSNEISIETTDNYKMLFENAIAKTFCDLYDAEIKRSLGERSWLS